MQKQMSNNQLYVKVDDSRNPYQHLQPYVQVDSDAQLSYRLSRCEDEGEKSPETSASQKEEQLLTLRYTATPPPRVLFGPRLNTTPPKHTTIESGSYLSASRVSSPIFPRHSTDQFLGRRGREAPSVSPKNSSSGIGTPRPTSPTVPRVGSPDNLEPFMNYFTALQVEARLIHQYLHLLPIWHLIPIWTRKKKNLHICCSMTMQSGFQDWDRSGLATLMKEVNDELEQMVLDRRREEQRERSGSIQSSKALQSQRPSRQTVEESTEA